MEDTPYIFSWSDFRVSDVDGDNLLIKINELQKYGLLKLFDGVHWTALVAGQRVARADIDAGNLRFVPDLNESGFAGFTYQAEDGYLSSALASMSINIIPVVDTPVLNNWDDKLASE